MTKQEIKKEILKEALNYLKYTFKEEKHDDKTRD